MNVEVESQPAAHPAAPPSGLPSRNDPIESESRGWTSAGEDCAPKLAAIASLARLPEPPPVPGVSYTSRGNVLVVAGLQPERARRAAAELAASLPVTLIEEGARTASAAHASWSGRVAALEGYLGQFKATLEGLRTADAPAEAQPREASFDLVLDFSKPPLFAMRLPPQGYHAAPDDDAGLRKAFADLADAVGEFEKPRFFAYRENLCAHSRSEIVGCNACIEICSTAAISPDGDKVKVDPHLCMGCGACATVCPSGAMTYQFPRTSDRGARVKQLLAGYREAGGRDACVVFHDGGYGRRLLAAAAEQGAGLPPRALPVEGWHVAAIGLDLLLPAIAFGASQVVVLATPFEDREYLEALEHQMSIGETVLAALGYEGTHFSLIVESAPAAVRARFDALPAAATVPAAATFLPSDDKRGHIEFAIEHLVKHAPNRVEQVALPAGSPYGEVRVDTKACTLCMACVGACPESALMDGGDRPQLRFLERNCVQCGLCESTCPESAITLSPRLLLTPAVREARVLNETQPFHCVSCGKAFGTKQMVDAMLGRLTGHSMFAGEGALRRLQMCADCRVVDMMSNKSERSIFDVDR